MTKLHWTGILLGVLLLTACGSEAPAPSMDSNPRYEDGPALIARDEDEDSSLPELSVGNRKEEETDLLTMSSREEESYRLFCAALTENEFHQLMQHDGVDFMPDRVVSSQLGCMAYYNSTEEEVIVCHPEQKSIRRVFEGQFEPGRVMDVRWLQDDELLILRGTEEKQQVYRYRPERLLLEKVYSSPEGQTILSLDVTEEGLAGCILSVPQPTEEVSGEGEPPLNAEPPSTPEVSQNEGSNLIELPIETEQVILPLE